jgi:hypothetical protein
VAGRDEATISASLESESNLTILLYPEGKSPEDPAALAPRPPTLSGLTLGLLINGKRNSDHLLHDVAQLLGERYRLKGVLELTKPSHGRIAPKQMHDELSEKCDVVVTAIGD